LVLKETTKIGAQPDEVFAFFEKMEQNYLRWHPDHVVFKWVKGQGLQEGHEAYFEERIAGKLLKKTVVYTRIVPNEHIEFSPTFRLMRFFLPRMLFRIEPTSEGCLLTQEIHVRTGPIGAWLNRNEFNAVRQHMKEEGEALENKLFAGLQ
jgi:hypothetical protein